MRTCRSCVAEHRYQPCTCSLCVGGTHRARARRRRRSRRRSHRRAESPRARTHSNPRYCRHEHRRHRRRTLRGRLLSRGNRARDPLDRLGGHLPRPHEQSGLADATEGNGPRHPREPGSRLQQRRTHHSDDARARTEARTVAQAHVSGTRAGGQLRRSADSVSLRGDRHRRREACCVQLGRSCARGARQHDGARRLRSRSSRRQGARRRRHRRQRTSRRRARDGGRPLDRRRCRSAARTRRTGRYEPRDSAADGGRDDA